VPLPIERLTAVMRGLVARLAPGPRSATAAARAILTTDTRAKQHAVSVRIAGRSYVVGGMAKGAGMIHPHMATLLGVITTDAPLARGQAQRLLAAAVDRSFNAVTVDGDMSTNDSILFLANGAAGGKIAPGSRAERTFAEALHEVAWSLAESVAADGEGATKLLVVRVTGALSYDDARLVARTVASSLLVKTAVHGGDPNWGRLIAVAGRAGSAFTLDKAVVRIGPVTLFAEGTPYDDRAPQAAVYLQGPEIDLTVDLGTGGRGQSRMWTCDLSAEYVRINADYRT
jgi:glutamate N-acetyltransferase/amino-acid N-acetyltransferase